MGRRTRERETGRAAALLLVADHHLQLPARVRVGAAGRTAVQAAGFHEDVRDGGIGLPALSSRESCPRAFLPEFLWPQPGIIVGAGIAFLAGTIYNRTSGKQMQQAFTALAADALDANSKRLSDEAGKTLDSKKALIDQAITAVNERRTRANKYLQSIETERKKEFGALGTSEACPHHDEVSEVRHAVFV